MSTTLVMDRSKLKMVSERMVYDSHMHTPLCQHAVGEPEEYAETGHKNGLKGIIFTCHNPVPGGFAPSVRMRMEQLDEYVALVQRATDAWKGKLDVRIGIESDFVPGMEPWLEELNAKVPFNHVLGSVHPQLPEYRAEYFKGNVRDFQRTYFDHLAQSAETGLVDTVSHPDIIKDILPKDWDREALMDDIKRALDRIAATGVAMELNTSGLYRANTEMNPGPEILAEMGKRKIPVVLGSDSHNPERVSDHFISAIGYLIRAGYTQISHFLDRKRHDIDIMDALHSLQISW